VQRKEVKAVLFDLDGVLVDSIDAWFHIFNDTLKYFNKKTLSRDKFNKIFGMSIDIAARKYFDGKTVKQIEHIYFNFFRKNMNHFKLFSHTIKVLQNIKKQKI